MISKKFKKTNKNTLGYIKTGCTKSDPIPQTRYIRHQIHHPENKQNIHYTQSQLRGSIYLMRQFIISKMDN